LEVEVATRRQVLTALAGTIPVLAASAVANAWTQVSFADVGLLPPTGVWAALSTVTNGTDPSTALVAAPNPTPEIRALVGREVTLSGFLNDVPGGLLLSREPFHCPSCYPFGRGSLALAAIETSRPPIGERVRLTGLLELLAPEPSFVHFRIAQARLV
jgi:hypothetical protein